MRKLFIIPIAALTMIAGGCTKWLDVEPDDKILEKRAFSTEVGINNVLNGLYHTMVDNNLYGSNLTAGTVDFLAHYWDFPGATNIAGTKSSLYNIHKLGIYDYTAIHETYFTPMWNNGYGLILDINNFIARMEDTGRGSLSESRWQLYVGEAYGLRAMMHLDLYRLFGPVETTSTEGVLPYHSNAVIEIPSYVTPTVFLGNVMADLNKAEELLLTTDPIMVDGIVHDGATEDDELNSAERFAKMYRNKRMNYWAVQVLKMRVHMLLGENDKVIELANKILTDAVDENYTSFNLKPVAKKKAFAWTPADNIWSINIIMYDEVIMGPSKIDMQSWWNGLFDKVTPDAGIRMVLQPNLLDNIIGTADADFSLSAAADKRLIQWITNGSLMPMSLGDVNAPYYATFKLSNLVQYDPTNEEAIDFKTSNMRPLIRLAEVMYMRAESKLKTGDLDGAIADINYVLERRGFQPQGGGTYATTGLIPANATTDNAWDMLLHEYYREFVLEGQAWFYLKRNNYATMFLGTNGGNMTDWDAKNFVLPRPDAETNFDPAKE